jgi:hypothetical protein
MAELTKMRDGTEVLDPRLGRLRSFDPRSRGFGIAERVEDKPIRTRGWSVRHWLNQQTEGACVSFAWHHEALAVPARAVFPSDEAAEQEAFFRYNLMKHVDEWPGVDYDGTSVLAGAKVMRSVGYFDEYRWAFSLDDVLRALSNEGPVVLGTNWYEGMFDPDADGYLRVEGELAGGHAYLLSSHSVGHQRVTVWNSWGRDWGRTGRGYISYDDLERLLHEQGEACIPMGRHVR